MTTLCEVPRVNLTSLPLGSVVDVATKNRHYRIERLGGNSIRISGHPDHCPQPVLAQLRGAVDEEGLLILGAIVCGMRLTFLLNDHRAVATSKVVSLQVEQALGSHYDHDRTHAGSFPIPY